MEQIKHETGRFYIERGGDVIAELTYHPSGDTHFDINHTFVSTELRGQGVAATLLDKAVELARKENKKIIPTCSYAREKMVADDKYRDVLEGDDVY